MSKKNSKTTTSGMNWNEMLGLLQRLKKDNLVREYLLVGTGCYLGLRGSDLLNLKWSDVLNKEEFSLTEKKTGKIRTLFINKTLRDILEYSYSFFVKQEAYKMSEYMFSNKLGNKISIQYTNRVLHYILAKYKVKVTNPSTHTLRKTFGKRVWEMDNKSERALIYLSQIFNHSNVLITRKYIGIIQEDITNIYLGL